MHVWQHRMKQGLHRLAAHDACGALKALHEAIGECPVHAKQDLSRILFFTGVTLKRLGCADGAITSWLEAYRLTKDGYSSRMIARFSNGYGMEKQRTEELDDWMAFHSIHVSRYLARRKSKRFCCQAERDMIRDLLEDTFCGLADRLRGKTPAEKERLFSSTRIVFPTHHPGDTPRDPVIAVDFRTGRRLEPGDRCPCGSGLSYLSCCGRIPSLKEGRSGHI